MATIPSIVKQTRGGCVRVTIQSSAFIPNIGSSITTGSKRLDIPRELTPKDATAADRLLPAKQDRGLAIVGHLQVVHLAVGDTFLRVVESQDVDQILHWEPFMLVQIRLVESLQSPLPNSAKLDFEQTSHEICYLWPFDQLEEPAKEVGRGF